MDSAREYQRNWGVGDTQAIAAWRTGATGRGITVGVVDSGVRMNHQDLATNISPLSTDIVSGRNQREDQDGHGTRVASVIAAPFNDYGTVGVAFNSTILSIRADVSDCSKPEDKICFKSSDLARALDYAVQNGARVINLSIGGESPLGGAFEAALQRAVNAGVVFAIASGNEAGANPEWPGRYASDSRFAGAIIVAGAHNTANVIADFSNRAGVSQSVFLSAPGVDVIVDCEGDGCWRVNGTSFASPAVAGALALLLEAFPNLTGRGAVDILLRTGREAGDPGTDVVYGRGLLDISRAFQPVGTTTAPMAVGQAVNIALEPGAHVGGPFGDALGRTSALSTIAHDEYERLFRVDLGAAYRPAPPRSRQPDAPTPMRQSQVTVDGPGGARLAMAAATPVELPEPVVARYSPYDAPWLGDEPRAEALFDIQAGRLSLTAWQGQGGARSPFRSRAGDGFTALSQADHAVRGALNFGALTVSAERGAGDRRAPLRPVERDASTYARAGLDWRLENGGQEWGGLSFSLGALDERMGPLGAYLPTRSDFALPSRTRFAAVGADVDLGRGLTLSGEAGVGRTELAGRFLHLSAPALSSTWRASLQSACPSWSVAKALGCRSLTWEISQPLRIESGTFSAWLADVPLEYFDPVTFSERRFSAAPSGRQVDFSVRSLHALPGGSWLQLEAVASREEQHREGAPTGYALLGSWRRGF
ncbi:S8 family peptidase [Brevundimonas naejangsanensis]|uniref:S8 family peptidase n=1 Tax=Brevundimonas naejangsanensis TaxID=588932 RepID=UPI001F0A0189|nr:S8 family peptidase [Brevundimonas naejangsanensis]